MGILLTNLISVICVLLHVVTVLCCCVTSNPLLQITDIMVSASLYRTYNFDEHVPQMTS